MVYVFLANGFEETEAIVTIDILRRSEAEVVTVGIGDDVIVGAHGIAVVPDITEEQLILSEKVDMIVLPGGMPGTLNLEKSRAVRESIEYCAENEKYIAAICAAPSIIGKMGLLKGKKAVCFPGFEDFLEGAEIVSELAVCDENIITAKGPGAAVEFGLALSEILAGKPKAEKVRASLQCK